VFTAQEPEEVGPEKYDETAAAMIAQLKYGSGTAFSHHLATSPAEWMPWNYRETVARIVSLADSA
jgi:hypothetical protein